MSEPSKQQVKEILENPASNPVHIDEFPEIFSPWGVTLHLVESTITAGNSTSSMEFRQRRLELRKDGDLVDSVVVGSTFPSTVPTELFRNIRWTDG
jgi:hypothetical protein